VPEASVAAVLVVAVVTVMPLVRRSPGRARGVGLRSGVAALGVRGGGRRTRGLSPLGLQAREGFQLAVVEEDSPASSALLYLDAVAVERLHGRTALGTLHRHLPLHMGGFTARL
jgi:hypothetical protein